MKILSNINKIYLKNFDYMEFQKLISFFNFLFIFIGLTKSITLKLILNLKINIKLKK